MDSRGQEIAAELEQFLVAREEALQNLAEAHKATSQLHTHIASLGSGVTQNMTNYANSCADMVHRDIVRSIDNRCAYLSTISANTSARMLDRLAAGLPALVMLEHGREASGVSSNTLKQALAALAA